ALGVLIAHAMFDLPLYQISEKARMSTGQLLSEAVATCGLVFVIFSCEREKPWVTAAVVGAYIAAAYWFTASTSFANPAVTLARSLTATFAGIDPAHVLPFIAAQILGASLGLLLDRALRASTDIDRALRFL